MPRILVVVHRELHEEKIYGSVLQDVTLQPKGARCGAGGGNPSVRKSELGLGKTLLQPLHENRAIPVHFRNGTTHEGDVPLFLLLETMQRVRKVSTRQQIRV